MTGQGKPGAVAVQGGRLANFRIAAVRFGNIWTRRTVAAAGRDFAALWPVWTGGILLAISCAVGWDRISVTWVRTLPDPLIDFFQWLTDFGKSGWLLIPLGTFGLVLLLGNWTAINRRVAAAWTEVGLMVGFAFGALAGSGIIMNIIKQIVGRGRPVVFDSDGAFSLMPFQFDYAQASFPSGHSTTMGALAVVVATLFPRLRWLAFAFCGSVAASRVFVAAHYPSDVVAGFMLGAAFSWFFALALCHARSVFEPGADGTIKLRAIAVRRIFLRSGGFSIAMGSLWLALFGLASGGGRLSASFF